jgi:hypothetical protein
VRQSNITSIDYNVLEEIKMNGASIQGIYRSTIHLSLKDSIVTLGNRVTQGKHHIVIEDELDFSQYDLFPGMKIFIKENIMNIGELNFDINKESVLIFEPYRKIYKINTEFIDVTRKLKQMLKEDHNQNLFAYSKNDAILKYQFEKIDVFLNSPGLPSALSILGLGMGLTPLGDDILTGYILGLNSVGKSLPWIPILILEANKKTSRLSAQNLKDTYERYYPKAFIDMLEGLFINHDVNKAKSILNLGATSGAGILTGFIYGLM